MDISILVIYLIITFGVVIFLSRYSRTTSEYILANRELPSYLIYLSLLATAIGSNTILGFGGKIALSGVGYVIPIIGVGFGFILLGIIGKKMRESKSTTIIEYILGNESKNARIFLSIVMILCLCGLASAQIRASGFIINIFTGLNINYSIIIGVIIICLYTIWGGLRADVHTDAIQFLIIILILLALCPSLISIIKENYNSEVQVGKANMPSLNPFSIGILNFLGFLIVPAITILSHPDHYQRISASQSPASARKASIFAGLTYFPFAGILILLGLASSRYITYGYSQDELILRSVQNISPFLSHFFMAAIIAAIMSTVDSHVLAAGTIFINDIYKKQLTLKTKLKFEITNSLFLTRLSVVFVCIIGCIIAINAPTIMDILEGAWGLVIGIIVPLVFIRQFALKVSIKYTLFIIITGLIVISASIIYKGKGEAGLQTGLVCSFVFSFIWIVARFIERVRNKNLTKN